MWVLTLLAFLSSSCGILLAMLHYGSDVKHDTRASATTIIGGIWGCIHSSNRNTRSRSTHCHVPWNITLNVHTPLLSYLEDTYTCIYVYTHMQYGYISRLFTYPPFMMKFLTFTKVSTKALNLWKKTCDPSFVLLWLYMTHLIHPHSCISHASCQYFVNLCAYILQ